MSSIVRADRNAWSVEPVDASGVLVDGEEYFRAFYRAALTARRHVLLLGWELDSRMPLLRGDAARDAPAPVELGELLSWLCGRRRELRVYVLSWDWTWLFAVDREWFQRRRFESRGDGRIRFAYDDHHAVGASHHQKLAVIDGRLAFAGSTDFCANRWGVRGHRPDGPADGSRPRLNHEVQAWCAGPAAARLADLFRERWADAGQGELDLPEVAETPELPGPEGLPARRVGIHRTRGATVVPPKRGVDEVRHLLVDAIHAAERLIYWETQYFSSRVLLRALIERLREPARGRLDVVLLLPDESEKPIERTALAHRQRRHVRALLEVAAAEGHSAAAYYPYREAPGAGGASIYVHSKVLIVDDRFLTVGSANASDRCLGLDTELNLSWEAGGGDAGLAAAIRDLRVALLADLAGVGDARAEELAAEPRGLVERLEAFRREEGTLRPYPIEVESWEKLLPDSFGIDPAEPLIESDALETARRRPDSLLGRAIRLLDRGR